MPMVTAVVPVRVAEKILGASYSELAHAASNVTLHRILGGYSLPADVAAAVDFVVPTVHIAPPKAAPLVTPMIPKQNVPETLRSLYSVGDAVGKAPGNKMAVTAFLGQCASPPTPTPSLFGLTCITAQLSR